MKIICDKSILTEAVNGVSKAVSARSSLPVLEGILIKAEKGEIILTGYDLEMGITTSIDATILEEGEIVLSAKLFGDMVRKLNSDSIEITCDEETLVTTIKGGITEYNIKSMDSEDFPELPSTGADFAFEIEGEVLQNMINTTIYAVSQDDKKPAHTGELFVVSENKFTLVALDGFRLAICERDIKSDREFKIIVPAKTLSEVSKLIGDENPTVSINANRRYVVFSFGGYTIMSRLIEGEFLDYKKVVPTTTKTSVTISVKELISCLERASLLISDRVKDPLRITFREDRVVVRCQTTLGNIVDELNAKTSGDYIEVGFNSRYLLDALKYCGQEEILFEINNALSPIKVVPTKGNDFTFLVLPVRFKND